MGILFIHDESFSRHFDNHKKIMARLEATMKYLESQSALPCAPKPLYHSKTEKELSDEIFKITTIIDERFPELLKYIEEMPLETPERGTAISKSSLSGYNNSLDALLTNYAFTHQHAG
jgi:hypothetical protein